MKKILSLLVIILICVAGTFAFLYFGENNNEVKVSAIDFEGKFNEIGELSTTEYIYTLTQVVGKDAIKVANIEIPFTSSKIIYSYSGTIKAGINFKEIKIEVDETNKTVNVVMPEAQIFSNELDNDSFKIYDERNFIFNSVSVDDFNKSQSELKLSAELAAKEKGILELAKENAKTIIENTIKSLINNDSYKIEVK